MTEFAVEFVTNQCPRCGRNLASPKFIPSGIDMGISVECYSGGEGVCGWTGTAVFWRSQRPSPPYALMVERYNADAVGLLAPNAGIGEPDMKVFVTGQDGPASGGFIDEFGRWWHVDGDTAAEFNAKYAEADRLSKIPPAKDSI